MNPLCTLKLSDDAISLADALTATVSFDGLAPIAVTPPSPLLSETSRQSWQIKPCGPATLSKLLDGQERWTQVYRLEPFVPGGAVKIEFVPFLIANGAAPPIAVSLPTKTVNVKSSLAEGSTELRAITGPETLPPNIENPESFSASVLGVFAALLLLVVAIIARRLSTRRFVPATADASLAWYELVAEANSQRFADRLSTLIRERRQLTKQTTAEIAIQFPDSPLLPILERCDAVKFAGESLSTEDRTAMLASARQLLDEPK